MYCYPSMTTKSTASPYMCVNCLHQPTPIHHTATSSSNQNPLQPKCTCQMNNSSSSSISTTSEQIPIKLKFNAKMSKYNAHHVQATPQQKPIIVPRIAPRPERLQPQPFQRNECSVELLSLNTPTITEDYFSCSSDDIDYDLHTDPVVTSQIPVKLQDGKKNLVILQLLHEVVHLINEDNPIRDEAIHMTQVGPTITPTNMAPKTLQPMQFKQSLPSNAQTGLPSTERMETKTNFESLYDEQVRMPNIEKRPASENQIVQEYKPYETELQPSKPTPKKSISKVERPAGDELMCTCAKTTDVCPAHGHIKSVPKVEPIVLDDLKCICSKTTDVCPVHGHKKSISKVEIPAADDLMCTCAKTTDVCPVHDHKKGIPPPEQPISDDLRCICRKITDICPVHGHKKSIPKVEPPVSDDLKCMCSKANVVCPVHGDKKGILKVEPTVSHDLRCICSKTTDVCPVHGLKKSIPKIELPVSHDLRCICSKTTDVCPVHGHKEGIPQPEPPVADDLKCMCSKANVVCPVHGHKEGIPQPEPPVADDLKCMCSKANVVCPVHRHKKSIPQPEPPVSNDILCICPKPTDVCPMHGPLEMILNFDLKTSRKVEEKLICICTTEEEKCPIHGGSNPRYTEKREDGVTAHNNTNEYDPYEVEFALKDVTAQPFNAQVSEVFASYEHKIKDEPSQSVPLIEEIESTRYIVRTSASTGRNNYNFLPEFDRPDEGNEGDEGEDYFEQLGRYNPAEVGDYEESYIIDYEGEEFDVDSELAKEKQAERYKQKNRLKKNVRSSKQNPITDTTIATKHQIEGEGSPAEMKFFIDSLVLDLDSMEHARRKSNIEKNICMPRPGMCPRKSFPVTITSVTDLGVTSLYVKWIIHDCYGIDGYELYTDGYLTNRYYNGQHKSAVITNVDVTIPHKIALVAQSSSAEDKCIENICNPKRSHGKCNRSIPWKPDVDMKQKSFSAPTSSLWTPSIYLYDPVSCNAAAAPPIMRESN